MLSLPHWPTFPWISPTHFIGFSLDKIPTGRLPQSLQYLPSPLPYHMLCAKLLQSCVILCNPMDYIACQAPLSMGISRQEYWSGLPCPSPRDLPNPGTEPTSLTSPLADGFFTTSATWEGHTTLKCNRHSTVVSIVLTATVVCI